MKPAIVLIHGLSGFNALLAGRRPAKEFFPGVRKHLTEAGFDVFVPNVSPTASVAARAGELAAALEEHFGRRPLHLIGHSLGGLDARYLTTHLGYDERVVSLTTIGTPHRGSPFADWAVRRLERFYRPLFRAFGVPVDAFRDLTTDACFRFNERTPDVPNVPVVSVAGVCDKPWLGPEWWFPARIVDEAEGPNDGIVSLRSAAWGSRTETWQADHLNLVNWPNRIMQRAGLWTDRGADYERLIQDVRTSR